MVVTIDKRTLDSALKRLPEDLVNEINKLSIKGEGDFELLIKKIKKLDDKQRKFALLLISEEDSIAVDVTIKILFPFLKDSSAIIRERMIVNLTVLGVQKIIPTLKELLGDEEELVRAAAIWSLAKFGVFDSLSDKAINELLEAKEDRSRSLLAAALFLINGDKESREMQILKQYFLDNYYDFEEGELYCDLLSWEYDTSANCIGAILWEAGIELFRRGTLEYYRFDWLIKKLEKNN